VAAHLPLDVVGGAALGLVLAELANAAVGIPVGRAQVAPRAHRGGRIRR
jgi:membrane-associated phospholipid phosphatase